MSKEKMHSNKSEELEILIKGFLKKLSNDYAFLFFSQHGLEILSKGGMGVKKFSEVPTFTLGEGGPEDPNAIILYHETGKIIHENICKDYPRRMMNHFIIDLYESWEKTRSSLSEIFEKNRNEIKSDIFGDVRNARNDLLHKSYVLAPKNPPTSGENFIF